MRTDTDIAVSPMPPRPTCAEVTERVRKLEALVERLTKERRAHVREITELRALLDGREAPPALDALPV